MIGAGEVTMKRREKSGLWHPGRSVGLSVRGAIPGSPSGTFFGTLGEIHPAILSRFGIDGRVAVLDFDLAALIEVCESKPSYAPIPQFPPVLRDIAFVVGERLEYGAVESAVRGASSLLKEVELFDVYRGANLEKGMKSLALHLTFAHAERTLTAAEADEEFEKITRALEARFEAKVRG
jgi:phenylalanyl-tRNA synthetase beta chain